jgi:hypothetical protein
VADVAVRSQPVAILQHLSGIALQQVLDDPAFVRI